MLDGAPVWLLVRGCEEAHRYDKLAKKIVIGQTVLVPQCNAKDGRLLNRLAPGAHESEISIPRGIQRFFDNLCSLGLTR